MLVVSRIIGIWKLWSRDSICRAPSRCLKLINRESTNWMSLGLLIYRRLLIMPSILRISSLLLSRRMRIKSPSILITRSSRWKVMSVRSDRFKLRIKDCSLRRWNLKLTMTTIWIWVAWDPLKRRMERRCKCTWPSPASAPCWLTSTCLRPKVLAKVTLQSQQPKWNLKFSWSKSLIKKIQRKLQSRQSRHSPSRSSPAWRNQLIFTMSEMTKSGAFKLRRKTSCSSAASLKASKRSCLGRAGWSRPICKRFENASSTWISASAGSLNCTRWPHLISLRMDLSARHSISTDRRWAPLIASSWWLSRSGMISQSLESGHSTWRILWMSVSRSGLAKLERHATLCF